MEIILGDCLEIMLTLEAGSVDLILTDPPYGTTQCKWDAVIPFDPMWSELKRLIKPNGAIVLTASQPFTSALIMSNPKMFKYCWVWDKNKGSGHLNSKKRPLVYHEDIVVFYQKQCTYNPQMTVGHRPGNYANNRGTSEVYNKHKSTEYGGQTERHPRSIQKIKVVNNDGSGDGKFHSTQKPVALMEYLIKTYTNQGEMVLDFTMGSGTTGVACVNLDRDFIGIEKDEEYFEIAENRIKSVIEGTI